MIKDKDHIIRYGGMYAIGMAYVGTSNSHAIKKLRHFAVSDTDNDVRRAAVTNIGFILWNHPEKVP